jgi:hypothetical protein
MSSTITGPDNASNPQWLKAQEEAIQQNYQAENTSQEKDFEQIEAQIFSNIDPQNTSTAINDNNSIVALEEAQQAQQSQQNTSTDSSTDSDSNQVNAISAASSRRALRSSGSVV